MIEVSVPGFGDLRLEHAVCDYNGTLACDGLLLPGVADALLELADDVRLHVVTADTFGCAASQLSGLPVQLRILAADGQGEAKLHYVVELGSEHVVTIGNGRNDAAMLQAGRLGIAVMQAEGASAAAVRNADIVVDDVIDALNLLRAPRRLIATLRT